MQDSPNFALETSRLVLRPLDRDDVDLLGPDMSGPEVSRHMAWAPHTTTAQTLAFLDGAVARRQSEKGVTWAILSGFLKY